MCGTAHDRHRSRGSARCTGLAVGLALALALAPAALCADELSLQELREIEATRPRLTPAFSGTIFRAGLADHGGLDAPRNVDWNAHSFQAHWLATVEGQLQRISHGDLATYPGRPLDEEMYYESVNQAAFTGLRRATGRALEEYLLAETGLDRVIERFGNRVDGTTLAGKFSGRLSSPRAVSIDLGVSSFWPEVQLKPRLGDDKMRIRIRANGLVGLDYRTARWGGQSWVATRLDPVRQRYTFSYLLAF